MQNLEKAIAKLDKEIEAKSNKILSLNENTKLTFLYIDNNIKKLKSEFNHIPLNKRYNVLIKHLSDKGYSFKKSNLNFYLAKHGFLCETYKIIINLVLPILFGILSYVIVENINHHYSIIAFANTILICALITSFIMEK